jgi:peptide/nickel transport system permease protein
MLGPPNGRHRRAKGIGRVPVRYILRRVASGVLSYMVIVFAYTAILNLALETTARSEIAEQANSFDFGQASTAKTAEERRAMRDSMVVVLEKRYGLDRPYLERVAARTLRIIGFDYGASRSAETRAQPRSNRVADIIFEALPNTAILFSLTTALSVLLGIVVGIRKARKPGSAFDRVTSTLAMVFFGTPAWWVASFSVLFFVYQLKLLPFGVLYSLPRPPGAVARFLDAASYYILPVATIAFVRLWGFAYMAKSMLLLPMQEEFVAAARGRGIPEGRIFRRHVLRSASPGIATMSTLLLVDSICGDFLVEWVFARPGLGTLMWQSIRSNDLPLASGILAVFTLFYCSAVVFLDIVYGFLDPRIRTG